MESSKYCFGNYELLNIAKIAFLCSRRIPASVVLKCYDWAIAQREKGICVVSGFHSPIEKDVFRYLAKGKQPIILVLARGLKTNWEPEFRQLFLENRLLVISPFDDSVKRITAETCAVRNKLMVEIADSIVVGYAHPEGQLENIFSEYIDKNLPIPRFSYL